MCLCLQLLTDVQSQRMEFVKALESKISQIEQEQGKISGVCVRVRMCVHVCVCVHHQVHLYVPAKKKQALYESLEAQVYCDKAKVGCQHEVTICFV